MKKLIFILIMGLTAALTTVQIPVQATTFNDIGISYVISVDQPVSVSDIAPFVQETDVGGVATEAEETVISEETEGVIQSIGYYLYDYLFEKHPKIAAALFLILSFALSFSEIMGLISKFKSNGILHGILVLLQAFKSRGG